MKTNNILAKYPEFSGAQMREFSIKKIALQIIEIMHKHIGHEQAIEKERLFSILFRKTYSADRLDHWMLWEFTKRAMHKLRRDSNCFIASCKTRFSYEYFVVADATDVDFYILQLDQNIKKMRSMQKRAQRAVDENWHREEWCLDYKPKKQLFGFNL